LTIKLVFVGAVLLVLSGCAAKHIEAPSVNVIIEPQCHPTVTLIGCTDTSVSPPTGCKRAKAKYDKGCEKLEAVKP